MGAMCWPEKRPTVRPRQHTSTRPPAKVNSPEVGIADPDSLDTPEDVPQNAGKGMSAANVLHFSILSRCPSHWPLSELGAVHGVCLCLVCRTLPTNDERTSMVPSKKANITVYFSQILWKNTLTNTIVPA
jgi:hypothetical protein